MQWNERKTEEKKIFWRVGIKHILHAINQFMDNVLGQHLPSGNVVGGCTGG